MLTNAIQSIAAAAIAADTSIQETVAAGALTGAAVFLLGLTGAISLAMRWIPVPVVKGIQMGAGLSLCITSGRLIQGIGWINPILDNRLWATAFFVTLLLTQLDSSVSRRFPYALILFVLGIAFAIVVTLSPLGKHDIEDLPGPTIWVPSFLIPAFCRPNVLGMALAQLPLTLLNSVIAVSVLSAELLPDIEAPSPAAMAVSVGMMNILGCWFGSMPVCHGSGGLAAQYRFGARSGSSIIILGLFKLVVGLVFGDSIVGLLNEFPRAALGVMVLAAGLELSNVGESLNSANSPDLLQRTGEGEGRLSLLSREIKGFDEKEKKRRWTVMLLTIAGVVGFRNTGIGFVAGMLCHWSYKVADWTIEKHEERMPLLSGR